MSDNQTPPTPEPIHIDRNELGEIVRIIFSPAKGGQGSSGIGQGGAGHDPNIPECEYCGAYGGGGHGGNCPNIGVQ